MRSGVAVASALLALLAVVALLPEAKAHRVDDGWEPRFPGDPPPPLPPHHDVLLKNGSVTPRILHLRAGDHVNFTNGDRDYVHMVVSDQTSLNSSWIWPGKTYVWVAPSQGNFTYRDPYHPTMQGILSVAPPPPPNLPPLVTITSPKDGATVRDVIEVRGTVEDPEDDWFRLLMRIDDGAWRYIRPAPAWAQDVDTTQLPNGLHTLQVAAEDATGQRSDPVTLSIRVENPQAETQGNYAVMITRPFPDERVAGEVTIEGISSAPSNRSGAAPVTVRVRIDDGPWKEAEGDRFWSYRWDTRTVKDGAHRIQALATDGRTVSQVSTTYVLVANAGTAQVKVAILQPNERERVRGVVEVRGTAEDPQGRPYEVLVRVDGGDWAPAQGTEQWVYRWNSSLVANGPHVIEAIARTTGSASVTAKVTVFADNAEPLDRPKVEVDWPPENARLTSVVLVQGTASSTSGTPLTVQVRVNELPWEEVSGTARWAYTLNTTDFPNGVHTIRARAFDGRGYSEDVAVRVLVANAPPSDTVDERSTGVPLVPVRANGGPEEEPKLFGLPAPPAALVVATVAALALVGRGARRR